MSETPGPESNNDSPVDEDTVDLVRRSLAKHLPGSAVTVGSTDDGEPIPPEVVDPDQIADA